ncbi:MAG TPA: cation:proton antiporter [Longimicrobiales bacterium]
MEEWRLLFSSGLLLGAIALGVIIFRGVKVSSIPAFILLGLALHPVAGESELVEVFAVFGVVLLLFAMGLEFSPRALVAGRARITANGLRDLVISFPVGFVAGMFLGWGVLGALLLAGAFYVTSSAIVAKSVIEMRRTAHPETEVALGVLVFEDLAIALLLALLSGVALAGGGAVAALAGVGRALLFFAVVAVLAWVVRRPLERLLSTDDDDLFLLAAGAVVLLLSGAAAASGLSEAIGAFLAGTLLSETGQKARIETLFAPFQGLFAALFFVSFGLSIDIGAFADVWLPAAIIAVLAVVAKLGSGWWIGRADGLSPRGRLALGMMLIPRGEFSIVLAGLAAAAGFTDAPPLIAMLVLVLAVAGVVGMRYAPEISERLFPRVETSLSARGFRPELAADKGIAQPR